MTAAQLKEQLILLSADELPEFLTGNKNKIQLLFLQAKNDAEIKRTIEEILLRLTQFHLPEESISTIQIQSFFIHLAFYFKKVNKQQFVETCHHYILDSVFSRRLDAWLYYKRYHNAESHISLFENYIQIISSARYEDEDDYTYDLLSDLKEYKDYTDTILSVEKKDLLKQKFENVLLMEEWPILKLLHEQKVNHIPGLDIIEYDEKEYEPSMFSEEVFKRNFLDIVRERSQPQFPTYLYGYHKDTVIYEIIKQGQADFDAPYETLEPEDKVKLYCYFNMRKHFFSSLSLYERSQIYEKYYNTGGRIHFIDIGCGPGTSGLAFTEYLWQETEEQVVFDYYGVDVSEAMKNEADRQLTNKAFNPAGNKSYYDSVLEIDISLLSNATCLILNASYVFASVSLNVDNMVTFVQKIRAAYPFTPKYLLFQNPDKYRLNIKYEEFKNKIGPVVADFSEVETIFYYTKRGQYMNVRNEPVYYEIVIL